MTRENYPGWLSMEPDRANLELRPDDEPGPPPPRWPALVVAFCAGVLALAVVLVVADVVDAAAAVAWWRGRA